VQKCFSAEFLRGKNGKPKTDRDVGFVRGTSGNAGMFAFSAEICREMGSSTKEA
jgi:hypothetical protein